MEVEKGKEDITKVRIYYKSGLNKNYDDLNSVVKLLINPQIYHTQGINELQVKTSAGKLKEEERLALAKYKNNHSVTKNTQDKNILQLLIEGIIEEEKLTPKSHIKSKQPLNKEQLKKDQKSCRELLEELLNYYDMYQKYDLLPFDVNYSSSDKSAMALLNEYSIKSDIINKFFSNKKQFKLQIKELKKSEKKPLANKNKGTALKKKKKLAKTKVIQKQQKNIIPKNVSNKKVSRDEQPIITDSKEKDTLNKKPQANPTEASNKKSPNKQIKQPSEAAKKPASKSKTKHSPYVVLGIALTITALAAIAAVTFGAAIAVIVAVAVIGTAASALASYRMKKHEDKVEKLITKNQENQVSDKLSNTKKDAKHIEKKLGVFFKNNNDKSTEDENKKSKPVKSKRTSIKNH